MNEKRTNHLLWAIPVTSVVAIAAGFVLGAGTTYPEQELNGCYEALGYADEAFEHLNSFAKSSAEGVAAAHSGDILTISSVTGDFKVINSDIAETREGFNFNYDICLGNY